jgi:hypothetical protein
MRNVLRHSLMMSMLAAILLFVLSSIAHGQGSTAAMPSAAAFDPHDLSGLWNPVNPNAVLSSDIPMTPAGLAYYRNQQAGTSNPPVNGPDQNDPVFQCEPSSVPRNYHNTHTIEIEHVPGKVLMLFQAWRNFRIIYADGRKMPDHPEGTWYGDSIGHWEGNTFVVETANFNGRSWIDQYGHPTSDKMRLVERFTRKDRDHLENEITITDPVNYTKPWGGKKSWVLRNDWMIEDYMCSPSDVRALENAVTVPANQGDPLGLSKK